jgi:site-specific DNA recombinase
LFDERGERLTPSHAVKGARRYRYYVSRQLIQCTADQAHRGWRLPAAEIERIVAVAAGQRLDDQKALLDAIPEMAIGANRIPAILHSATAWSCRLQSEAERAAVLTALVERVELDQEAFRLALELPLQPAENPDPACPAPCPHACNSAAD